MIKKGDEFPKNVLRTGAVVTLEKLTVVFICIAARLRVCVYHLAIASLLLIRTTQEAVA